MRSLNFLLTNMCFMILSVHDSNISINIWLSMHNHLLLFISIYTYENKYFNQIDYLDFWDSSDNGVLNSALVGSTDDTEISVLSPVDVPWVGNKPVWSSVVSSPSKNSDGMSSEFLSSGVNVDSGLVLVEVLVDSECGLDWSVGNDFSLDLGDLLSDGVSGASEVLVSGVGNVVVLVGALVNTSWGIVSIIWARWPGNVSDGLSAWGKGVWLASELSLVRSSGAESALDKVLPGVDWVSSLASVSAVGAARKNIFSWEKGVDGSVGGDAETIRSSLGGSERPAGSTVRLVTDVVDWHTVWPLGTGIECCWNGILVDIMLHNLNIWSVWGNEFGSHETLLDLFNGDVLWNLSLPERLLWVHILGDSFLGFWNKWNNESGGNSHQGSKNEVFLQDNYNY